VLVDERAEVEARHASRGCVTRNDIRRRQQRLRVDERLRVREDSRKLNIVKQLPERARRVVASRDRYRLLDRARRRRRRADAARRGRREREECGG
jgi:hypothetical protein